MRIGIMPIRTFATTLLLIAPFLGGCRQGPKEPTRPGNKYVAAPGEALGTHAGARKLPKSISSITFRGLEGEGNVCNRSLSWESFDWVAREVGEPEPYYTLYYIKAETASEYQGQIVRASICPVSSRPTLCFAGEGTTIGRDYDGRAVFGVKFSKKDSNMGPHTLRFEFGEYDKPIAGNCAITFGQ